MTDFYSSLSSLESEALKRARLINENERRALDNMNSNFHSQIPVAKEKRDVKKHPSLFDFSGESQIIIALLLILGREQSDPLLMLALIYILM